MTQIIEVNVQTGEEIRRDVTQQELAQLADIRQQLEAGE